MAAHASTSRSPGEYPDLRAVAFVARRGWWVLLLATVAAALLAKSAASAGADRFQATAAVLVGPVNAPLPLLRAAGERATTYADLARSRRVVGAARARLGLAESTERLRTAVQAETKGSSRVIEITATAATAGGAARLANAVAAELGPTLLRDPRRAAAEFRIVDPAIAPRGPVASHRGALVLFAGVAALLAAFTLLLVVDYFRGRIATAEDLVSVARAPLLATVDSRAPAGGYDVLAARIRLARSDTAVRSVLITGDGAGEICDRLARAMDATGVRAVRMPASADAAPGDIRRMLRRRADQRLVLLDAPPADQSAAALAWTRVVDGVIVVARRGRSSRDGVAESAAALRHVGGSLLGTVLSVGPRRRLPWRTAPGDPRRVRRGSEAPADTAPAV